MSDLTRGEKNRLLAEWLEPMPTWKAYEAFMLDGKVGGTMTARSPLGVWQWQVDAFTICGEHSWKPADFYTDEAVNALLLEKLSQALMTKHEDILARYQAAKEKTT